MPAAKLNHYATLGLGRSATIAQIRDAYRRFQKRHHPDLHPDSPEALQRSQALNEAHVILSDPAKRRAYDRDLDSEGKGAPSLRIGKIDRDVSQDVQLRLEEFFRGSSLDVRVNDPANPGGLETYQLIVPPNTAPGTRFRIVRHEPFRGGFVQIRVRASPNFRFKVRGSELKCELRISPQLATKGGTERIAGPTGTQLAISIPAGVRRGEVLRIAGEGLPAPRGGRGDILVRVTYRPEVRVTRR